MGNSHSKSTALGLTKLLAKALELLRSIEKSIETGVRVEQNVYCSN